MADILEEIVAHKRIEIEQRKRFIQPRQMITLTEQKMQEDGGKVPGGSMKESLMNSETGIIAEFKRKSPSKGWIKQEGKPSIIPLAYQQNGASALSILTGGLACLFVLRSRQPGGRGAVTGAPAARGEGS